MAIEPCILSFTLFLQQHVLTITLCSCDIKKRLENYDEKQAHWVPMQIDRELVPT